MAKNIKKLSKQHPCKQMLLKAVVSSMFISKLAGAGFEGKAGFDATEDAKAKASFEESLTFLESTLLKACGTASPLGAEGSLGAAAPLLADEVGSCQVSDMLDPKQKKKTNHFEATPKKQIQPLLPHTPWSPWSCRLSWEIDFAGLSIFASAEATTPLSSSEHFLLNLSQSMLLSLRSL